jgi:hypothetical protein
MPKRPPSTSSRRNMMAGKPVAGRGPVAESSCRSQRYGAILSKWHCGLRHRCSGVDAIELGEIVNGTTK